MNTWTKLITGSLILLTGIAYSCNKTGKDSLSSRPNILICIADDASYPHMGAYGCSWISTPGFDEIARQGLLFTNAYTPNAKCSPSRACILTGRYSWQLEEAANHWCYFPEKFRTYAEALGDNEYFVGYTAKGWSPGRPGEIDGKTRRLTGIPFNDKKMTPPAKFISGIDYSANFRDFMDAKPAGKPFCFWYGCYEPHRAYEYGAGVDKGGKSLSDIDLVLPFWPDSDTVRTDMLDYAYEIEYFDLHLRQMLETLDANGELDNTLVIVTADNGMPFPRVKSHAYEYSNHMPLAVMWKNGINKPGRVVDDFVSFIDFAPTFLELAKIEESESGMQPVTGKSLTNIFLSDKSGIVDMERDRALIGKERHDVGRPHDWGYPIRGIVKDDYLYILNFEPSRWPACDPETGYLNTDGSPTKTQCIKAKENQETFHYWQLSFGKRPDEELFNIEDDPACINNLAFEAEFLEVRNSLNEQLMSELKEQGDPRVFGNGSIFDEYIYADERTRNFYERYMSGELSRASAGWVNESDFEK